MRWLQLAMLAAIIGPAAQAVAAEKKVVVFAFELIDSSLEGQSNGKDLDETARLDRLATDLRADIDAEPGFVLLDPAPVEAKARERWLNDCGRCAVQLGREVGADIVVTGMVQKVSDLILNINAKGYDVASGTTVAGGSVDIRGNTDEMWDRGLRSLWKNRLKKQLLALE